MRGLLYPLGEVTGDGRLTIRDGGTGLVDVSAAECRKAWSEAMPRLMGIEVPA
jgi:hypothetical protein